jgi:hypothetical protein
MGTEPQEVIPLGVVVERRASDNPWIDHTWAAVEVLPGAPVGPWRRLAEGDGWTRFFAGVAEVGLHRRMTEGYRRNLSEPVPSVYVVLRSLDGERDEAPALEAFLATVCPYEAEAYAESGDEMVEAAPMPPEVIARVRAFVDIHHVDQPFIKRKQKRKDRVVDHGE